MHYGLAVQQGHLTLFLEPHETFLQNAFCYLAVIERVVVCFIAALVQLYGAYWSIISLYDSFYESS